MSGEIVIGSGARFALLSASAMRQALLACAEASSAQGGAGCVARFDTSGGLAKRIASGEAADLVGSSFDSLAGLHAQGLLHAAPCVVGVSRLALGVRRGEAAPDVSTLAAFRQTVLGARRISRGDPAGGGTAGVYFADLFERLGLTEPTRDKTVWRVGGYNVMQAVADGEADFGLTQSTEIVAPSVALGAFLPDEIQLVTRYALALVGGAANAAGAQSFLDFALAPEGAALFAQAGFAPA